MNQSSAAFQPSGTVVFDDGSELTDGGYATENDFVDSGSDYYYANTDGVINTNLKGARGDIAFVLADDFFLSKVLVTDVVGSQLLVNEKEIGRRIKISFS